MDNWYVIQVMGGREVNTLRSINELVNKDVLIESFIPMIERFKKYKGEWKLVNEPLFPGYIFLITNDIACLYQELKKVPKLTKLLGMDKDEIYPLSYNEVAFIKAFVKHDDYTIDLSVGLIEGDKVKIIKGPLIGKEAMIRKIDRHKRIAYLDVDFFNQTLSAKVGLEIIKKD